MIHVEVEPGVRLHVQDVGDGPPVVLLAGFGLDHGVWDGVVCTLSARYRVLAVDLRGTGRSDKPAGRADRSGGWADRPGGGSGRAGDGSSRPGGGSDQPAGWAGRSGDGSGRAGDGSGRPGGGYGMARLARDVGTVLERLDLHEVTLVGYSFGGQVALALAGEDSSRLRRLVLVCSHGARASRSDGFPFGRDADRTEQALVRAERERRPSARRMNILSGFHSDPDPDLVD